MLECWDRKVKDYVAVKIVRNVDKYRHAAMIEVGAGGCCRQHAWPPTNLFLGGLVVLVVMCAQAEARAHTWDCLCLAVNTQQHVKALLRQNRSRTREAGCCSLQPASVARPLLCCCRHVV